MKSVRARRSATGCSFRTEGRARGVGGTPTAARPAPGARCPGPWPARPTSPRAAVRRRLGVRELALAMAEGCSSSPSRTGGQVRARGRGGALVCDTTVGLAAEWVGHSAGLEAFTFDTAGVGQGVLARSARWPPPRGGSRRDYSTTLLSRSRRTRARCFQVGDGAIVYRRPRPLHAGPSASERGVRQHDRFVTDDEAANGVSSPACATSPRWRS